MASKSSYRMPSMPLSPVSPGPVSKMSTKKQSWQQIVNSERAVLSEKIPPALRLHPSIVDAVSSTRGSITDFPRQCGILTQLELEITENFDATALLERIASGQLSSLVVTMAFCKRAAIAQQLVNCLSEIMFDEALSRATYCDEFFAREKRLLGPFHGLPISLQDSFNIKGIRSSLGLVDFLKHDPEISNSALVDILIAQGAVLYVKTNVSQTMMAFDTDNNVFGRTSNPHGQSLTAGGTAGGEAALMAMRGSILGVGADLAGGLRIPAMCCGVIGFKPSCYRIASGGQTISIRRGAFGIHSSVGPLCHSTRDAQYFMRSILQFDGWSLDEATLPIPWISPSTPASRKFGVIFEDKKYPLHPAVSRNFRHALQKIALAGHQIVPLNELLPDDIVSSTAFTAMTVLNMDPEKTTFGYVARGNEPLVPSVAASVMPELARMKPNINGVFNLNNDISNVRSMFREVIVENNLDAIFLPTYQSTAVGHDKLQVPAYTILANLLDYPSCVLPFGKAEKLADSQFIRTLPYQPEHDPDVVEGAPSGFQIIGRNLRDEDLLACARTVEDILKS